MCEQCVNTCVNMHLWIASLNPLYPAWPFVIDVYIHIHVLHCHLHITMCQHLSTICEHYCVNIHLSIVSWNTYDPLCLSKIYVYLHVHVLHYDHVSPSVNTAVWTLLCEHPSVNCFFKGIVPCMSMHNATLSTSTCTTLPLAYHHVSPSVNTTVWTCICELFL